MPLIILTESSEKEIYILIDKKRESMWGLSLTFRKRHVKFWSKIVSSELKIGKRASEK